MDLIGHIYTARRSGLFSDTELNNHVVELMFPNLRHCHDWAYMHAWEIKPNDPYKDTLAFIRAHMICDWIIHYGDACTHNKSKVGWVYKHLNIVTTRLQSFLEGLFLQGADCSYLESRMGTPKGRLDINHTLLELAIDFYIADFYPSQDDFKVWRKAFGKFSTDLESNNLASFWRLCSELQAYSDKSDAFIECEIYALSHFAAHEWNKPTDYAVFTAMRKYQIPRTAETVNYVSKFLYSLATVIEHQDIDDLFKRISDCIINPNLLYSGPWQPKNLRS